MAANKHAGVTAASLLRMATAHKKRAEAHRRIAKDRSYPAETCRHHASIGITHAESVKILRDEAKTLRGQA